MSRDAVSTLIDRFLNEPDFRSAFSRDPEAAVRHEGIDLSESEFEALRAAVWTHADEPLKSRVSRGTFGA